METSEYNEWSLYVAKKYRDYCVPVFIINNADGKIYEPDTYTEKEKFKVTWANGKYYSFGREIIETTREMAEYVVDVQIYNIKKEIKAERKAYKLFANDRQEKLIISDEGDLQIFIFKCKYTGDETVYLEHIGDLYRFNEWNRYLKNGHVSLLFENRPVFICGIYMAGLTRVTGDLPLHQMIALERKTRVEELEKKLESFLELKEVVSQREVVLV